MCFYLTVQQGVVHAVPFFQILEGMKQFVQQYMAVGILNL